MSDNTMREAFEREAKKTMPGIDFGNRWGDAYRTPFIDNLWQGFQLAWQSQQAQGEAIKWTEPAKPNDEFCYDHVIGETPFGRFLITWKGWKEHDSPTIDETPWGNWGGVGSDLEDAKGQAEKEFLSRLAQCGQPPAPAEPDKGDTDILFNNPDSSVVTCNG